MNARAQPKYKLPLKIDTYLALAARYFKEQGRDDIVAILANARIEIVEAVDYDNWDGGQTGHDLVLHVPEQLVHTAISNAIDQNAGVELREILNKLEDVPGEHFSDVRISLDQATISPNWRAEMGFPPTAPTLAIGSNVDHVRLWGTGTPRIFLSHRATIKQEAKQLKDEFAKYGAASFVAHEDIEPTRDWQTEIERALDSMDVLVALLSDGFGTSHWTNQEVGVALGRGIPVVALRLDEDPRGFIATSQAVNGRAKAPPEWAHGLMAAFSTHASLTRPLLTGLVNQWENTRNFFDSMRLMDLLDAWRAIPADLLARIEAAFAANDQLYGCAGIAKKYPKFLARVKGSS